MIYHQHFPVACHSLIKDALLVSASTEKKLAKQLYMGSCLIFHMLKELLHSTPYMTGRATTRGVLKLMRFFNDMQTVSSNEKAGFQCTVSMKELPADSTMRKDHP